MHLVPVQLDLFVHVSGLPVDARPDKACTADLFKDGLVVALASFDQRGQDHDPAVRGHADHRLDDLLRALPLDRTPALWAVWDTDPGIEQTHVVIDLGHRAHGGARVVAHSPLIDRDRRAQTLDLVHIRLFHLSQELPSIGRQRFDVPASPLGIDCVERQARLARARQAGDDDQLVARDLDGDVL